MNMRHLRAVIAFAGASLLMTEGAMARTNWQGEVMFTAVTTACASDGWRVGDHALASFLPSALDTNGAKTYLALHMNRRNAYSLGVNGRIVAGSAYTGVGITSAGNSFNFAGALPQYTQTPSSLTLTTPFINMTGQISNFAGMTGCTVSFEGSFVRRR